MMDDGPDPRDAKLDRLFAAARQAVPDLSGVDRGFEARVLARIRERREPWHSWAWRLAPVFLALTLLFAGWLRYISPVRPADSLGMLDAASQEIVLLDHLAGE